MLFYFPFQGRFFIIFFCYLFPYCFDYVEVWWVVRNSNHYIDILPSFQLVWESRRKQKKCHKENHFISNHLKSKKGQKFYPRKVSYSFWQKYVVILMFFNKRKKLYVLGKNTLTYHPHSSFHQHCQILHNNLVQRIKWLTVFWQKIHIRLQQPINTYYMRLFKLNKALNIKKQKTQKICEKTDI